MNKKDDWRIFGNRAKGVYIIRIPWLKTQVKFHHRKWKNVKRIIFTGWGLVNFASHGFGLCHFAVDPIWGNLWGRGPAEVKPSAVSHWVIGWSVIVSIEKFLEPLNELKIILESALDKSVHWHNLKSESKNKTPIRWLVKMVKKTKKLRNQSRRVKLDNHKQPTIRQISD